MGIKIKTFNYMGLAGEIVHGKKWARGEDVNRTPLEYVEKRLDEIRALAKNPDHQMLAAFLEQEIAEGVKYALSNREPIEPTLYALRTCNPFHSPIANSLPQETVDSFKDVIPGTPAFAKFDENQQYYARQMLEGSRTRLVVSAKGATLKTGFESIEHTITTSAFPISQYFYAIHVAPECFPDSIVNIVRHAVGVEQIKNSHVSKTIRKSITERIQNGEYPEAINVDQALANNLKLLESWIKPRDTKLAAAYVKGKRDASWLEQYAPASSVLTKVIEGLPKKGIHHKWSAVLPVMILDLCEHVKDQDIHLATKAVYELATAMASEKVLECVDAKVALDRVAMMANTLDPDETANTIGVLNVKLIGHKLGIVSDQAVIEFVSDNELRTSMEKIMEKLYPSVIERARTLQSLGFKSDSVAMRREKGRALMDDLGM